MLCTHITHDCITKQCEISKNKCLVDSTHPIVHERAKVKYHSHRPSTSSQAAAPCNFLDLKLKSQVWKGCKTRDELLATVSQLLLGHMQTKMQPLKHCYCSECKKIWEPVLYRVLLDADMETVRSAFVLFVTLQQVTAWLEKENAEIKDIRCISLSPPRHPTYLCGYEWPASW